jgi:stage II sporulation protein D
VLLASGNFALPSPFDGWSFSWNRSIYRGSWSVVQLPDGRRGLVNALPLDAYLYGVVSREVSAAWAPAAQQAQAIVSRTYALLKLRPDSPYDMLAAQSDQAYGGIDPERVEGRAATDATAGIVLSYAGLPARVAFSACCGGRTADAGQVWRTALPYLPSIADPYCAGTPGYDWTATIALEAVAAALGQEYAEIGALRSARLDGAAPDERPLAVTFVGANSTFSTTPNAFRMSLGPSVVRSAYLHALAIDRNGAALDVAGTGRGHGVGLCQWGARRMGDAGASASDILSFYFPGTALGTG